MNCLVKCITLAPLLLLFCISVNAQALANIEESPVNWRLQNYVGQGVTVYYSSSSCGSGSLVFPGGTSSDDLNRFWALVMAAKIASQPVGIFYQVINGQCVIESYYLTP